MKEKLSLEDAIMEMATPGVPVPKKETDLEVLWQKISPVLEHVANFFGKKVRAWVEAFSALIDGIIGKQSTDTQAVSPVTPAVAPQITAKTVTAPVKPVAPAVKQEGAHTMLTPSPSVETKNDSIETKIPS